MDENGAWNFHWVQGEGPGVNRVIGDYLEKETDVRLNVKQVSHYRSMMGIFWTRIIAQEALRNIDALYVDQEACD